MKIYTNNQVNEMAEMLSEIKASIIKFRNSYNTLYAEYVRLQDENKHLKELVEFHKYMRTSPDEIIFPNTDERGLGEGDTPNDLSPLDL